MDRIELIRHHQLFQYEDRAWALSRHRHSCPAPSSSLFFFCWDGTMQSVDVGWLSQQVGTETGSIGRQILAATRCRQKWEESEGLLKRERDGRDGAKCMGKIGIPLFLLSKATNISAISRKDDNEYSFASCQSSCC